MAPAVCALAFIPEVFSVEVPCTIEPEFVSVDVCDCDQTGAIGGNAASMNVIRGEDIPGGVRDDADGGVRVERGGNNQRRQ